MERLDCTYSGTWCPTNSMPIASLMAVKSCLDYQTSCMRYLGRMRRNPPLSWGSWYQAFSSRWQLRPSSFTPSLQSIRPPDVQYAYLASSRQIWRLGFVQLHPSGFLFDADRTRCYPVYKVHYGSIVRHSEIYKRSLPVTKFSGCYLAEWCCIDLYLVSFLRPQRSAHTRPWLLQEIVSLSP